jgi:hypothetical protein
MCLKHLQQKFRIPVEQNKIGQVDDCDYGEKEKKGQKGDGIALTKAAKLFRVSPMRFRSL